MRNENISKENISTKQILQERESVKNISKENRIEFSGKLQKSVLEVQRKYGDILGFPHHVSETHPPMPIADRAAQFAPFAAHTGHNAGIKETARLTHEPLELSDEVIMKLNDQLNMIRDNIGTEQEISITYFVPDDKKSGGAYLTHSGIVKKIDEFERKLIMQDETVIPTEQISVIQGEMFKGLYE